MFWTKTGLIRSSSCFGVCYILLNTEGQEWFLDSLSLQSLVKRVLVNPGAVGQVPRVGVLTHR